MTLPLTLRWTSTTLACLLALPTLAEQPGGLITGNLGDQPLELTVVPEMSGATILGNYVDASIMAVRMDGDQSPVNLVLMLNGELPAPGEVALTIAFAREMGRDWNGDQDSLTLTLEDLAPRDGIVTLTGTITGQISGGPGAVTLPVTFSFDARLEAHD